MPKSNISLFVEDTAGNQYECSIPRTMQLGALAADFFDQMNWPVVDKQGRKQRTVIELVNPDNPEETTLLNGDHTLKKAQIQEGAILRIFPEAIETRSDFESFFKDTLNTTTDGEHLKAQKADPNAAQGEPIYQFTKRFFQEFMKRTVPSDSIFPPVNVKEDPKFCLILMPFGNDGLQQVYEDHVKPALEKEFGLEVKRVDDFHHPGSIMQSLWTNIHRAKVIVAELTGSNSNVFYEVGLCHALGKKVILLTQDIEDVPYDLRYIRLIKYDFTPRGCTELKKRLKNTIREIS